MRNKIGSVNLWILVRVQMFDSSTKCSTLQSHESTKISEVFWNGMRRHILCARKTLPLCFPFKSRQRISEIGSTTSQWATLAGNLPGRWRVANSFLVCGVEFRMCNVQADFPQCRGCCKSLWTHTRRGSTDTRKGDEGLRVEHHMHWIIQDKNRTVHRWWTTSQKVTFWYRTYCILWLLFSERLDSLADVY